MSLDHILEGIRRCERRTLTETANLGRRLGNVWATNVDGNRKPWSTFGPTDKPASKSEGIGASRWSYPRGDLCSVGRTKVEKNSAKKPARRRWMSARLKLQLGMVLGELIAYWSWNCIISKETFSVVPKLHMRMRYFGFHYEIFFFS